jgi:hypothetical protein
VNEVNRKSEERINRENSKKADPDDLEVGNKVLLKKHTLLKRKFESLYE